MQTILIGFTCVIFALVILILGGFGIRILTRQKPAPPPVPGATGTTPTPPATPKKGHGWACGIAILAIIGLVAGYVVPHLHQKARVSSTDIQPSEEWVLEWELPRGQFIRGKHQSEPMAAEIVKRDNESLWVNVHYLEYGEKEVARYRLGSTGKNSYEGDWEQETPRDFGRCDLHEISAGSWAGSMTGSAGIPAFTTLKRIR